jgi:hypothetical protein
MQEQVRNMLKKIGEPIKKIRRPNGPKLPAGLLAAIAVVGLLGLGGLGTAYALMHGHYTGYTDQLNTMVSAARDKFQAGAGEDATLEEQYNFYAALQGDINNLPGLLQKLNDEYPLLPGRATERSTGIADLTQGMDDLAVKLATLRQCIVENNTVSGKLTELLGAGPDTDVSADMAALSSRNDALEASVSGISLEGAFEKRRAEFAGDISRRGAALHYLKEESAVSGELLSLLSDAQSPLADVSAKLQALGGKNDALASRVADFSAKGVELTAADLNAAIAGRKAAIEAGIAYLGELGPIQADLIDFCTNLEGSTISGEKFADRLAGYMVWVNQLNDLQGRLDETNGKPEYEPVAPKRTLRVLGLTPTAESLLASFDAVNTLDADIKASGEMEKKIDSLIKDTKMKHPDKISALTSLSKQNNDLINSLPDNIPSDLASGQAKFREACQERLVFLGHFIDYVNEKMQADGHNTLYTYYTSMKTKYLADAQYYEEEEGPDGPNVKLYQQLASDMEAAAKSEKSDYNKSVSNQKKYKADYEASRKKYQALFAAE